MFTADLLHDESAEIARLAEQVTLLQSEVETLRCENTVLRQDAAGHAAREQVRGQVWDWFRSGGPDDETTREQVAGQVCSQFLTLGSVEPGLVTAAAVALVQSCPSGLSDAQVVAAAAACRQVVTFAELTQAGLTRELAWRYEARHDAAQALDLDDDVTDRVPDWVKDPAEIGLVAAVEEVAALARTSPMLLRERVEMLTSYADEHPVLHRALRDGQISTGRARLIARETLRLPGARERAWVQTAILPVAERLGEAALRKRVETLIAQADPQRYRDLLDEAAAAADTVHVRQRGYGQAALIYQGSLDRVAALHAALTHRAAAADPDNLGEGPAGQSATARDRRAVTAAAVLFDLVTDPATMPPDHQDHFTDPTHPDPTHAEPSERGQNPTGADSTDPGPADAEPSDSESGQGPVDADPVSGEPVGRRADGRADCRRGDTRPDGARAGVRVEPKVTLNVTIPFQVLQALWAGQPAPTAFGLIDVDGHGPIPAKALASLLVEYGARATWRCQILDDRPGSATFASIIGVGRAAHDGGYTPSPSVKALVQARSHHCAFPGCRRSATDSDLDHVIPYTAGGPTADLNLTPLCRRHHLLKHHTAFSPTLDPVTGQVTWRTPSGHHLTEPPDTPPPLEADADLPDAWPAPPF